MGSSKGQGKMRGMMGTVNEGEFVEGTDGR